MNIIIYCQHVLGVGHFFRTLEVAKAMISHRVTLVTGGSRLDIRLPSHIRRVELPGLMMDASFSGIYPANGRAAVEEVKKERRQILLDLVQTLQPDLFLIELYPFGRKAFRFELEPVLEYISQAGGPSCKVVCSIRDILVEKEDQHLHEMRAVNALNRWFDSVLVHADPRLIKLSETFSRMAQIKIPVQYTGFVTPLPDPDMVRHYRKQTGLSEKGKLIVASIGGGNVGKELLTGVIRAYRMLPVKDDRLLWVFTGPYMDDTDKKEIHGLSGPDIRVDTFCDDFVSLLSAADLSVSMAGYNTCMNIVAAGVPSLAWPFDHNREQRERIRKLMPFIPIIRLDNRDLDPAVLSPVIGAQLEQKKPLFGNRLNISGAQQAVKTIERLCNDH